MNNKNTPKNSTELPSEYHFHTSLDYNNDKKILAGLQIAMIATIGVMIGLAFLLDFPMKSSWSLVVTVLVTLGIVGAYLVLHELTHGAAAYLLSGVKPIFGIRLPYFFTGSPVYFNKPNFIVIALAPVVLWTSFFIVMLFVSPPDFFKSLYIALSINLAGASGDIFLAYVLIQQPSQALLQDQSGTEPKIYLLAE